MESVQEVITKKKKIGVSILLRSENLLGKSKCYSGSEKTFKEAQIRSAKFNMNMWLSVDVNCDSQCNCYKSPTIATRFMTTLMW